MVWREKKFVEHGSRWKYGVVALFVLVFVFLFWLLSATLSFDPVIPVLILILIVALIPVSVFVIDLCFCADFS